MYNDTNSVGTNNKYKSFSELLKIHSKKTKITQIQISEKTGYSIRTINRMFEGDYDFNGPHRISMNKIITMAIILKLNEEETKQLFYSVYPEFPIWQEIIEKGLNIIVANEMLDDNGLDLLGKI